MVPKRRNLKLLAAAAVLVLAAWLLVAPRAPRTPPVLALRLEIPDAAVASLRQQPRADVNAVLWEGGQPWPVRLHLKGTSSFRPIDDHPSFTIRVEQTNAPALRQWRKAHLNNCVEDPGGLNEPLGCELFRAAGYPVPRVGHAVVELNGRRLGLYVLKEGFTGQFLARSLGNPGGNFYEPKDGHDLDRGWERQAGTNDLNDLRQLLAACQETDLARRWEQLGRVLDLDRFITFMVLEVMIGHRDGYCMARNNFRVYHDPRSDRLVFLPHGMDQLFGKPDLTWQPQMQGLVAKAVIETPEGRRRYEERFRALFATVFDPVKLGRSLKQWTAELQRVASREESDLIAARAEDLRARVFQRHASLRQQLATPERQPLQFTNGRAALTTGWRPVDEPPGGKLDQTPAPDGRRALHIKAGPATAASWRAEVRLAAGRYRFEGEAMVKDVAAPAYSRNRGAGLRVVPLPGASPHDLVGTRGWTRRSVPFEVPQTGEVVLICELFASQGEAWFDLNSLALVVER